MSAPASMPAWAKGWMHRSERPISCRDSWTWMDGSDHQTRAAASYLERRGDAFAVARIRIVVHIDSPAAIVVAERSNFLASGGGGAGAAPLPSSSPPAAS
jgi:hypothetical protein